jgi:dTDP-4-dehydrorhamnose reductase
VNVYGLTKLAGERATTLLDDHLIVRTSWLFGGADERVDPVLATVRRASCGQRTGLIADQYGLPTYVEDLARALLFVLTYEPRVTGAIHVANRGTASWYEVGRYVLSVLDPTAGSALAPERLALSDCAMVGERPRNSTLSTERLASLGYVMPSWRDAVRRFCARLAAVAPPRSDLAVARSNGTAMTP